MNENNIIILLNKTNEWSKLAYEKAAFFIEPNFKHTYITREKLKQFMDYCDKYTTCSNIFCK
jgi:hypothetical protein